MELDEVYKDAEKWQVVFPGGVMVRQDPSLSAKILTSKASGDTVIGRKKGPWVELIGELGYMKIKVDDDKTLLESMGPYKVKLTPTTTPPTTTTLECADMWEDCSASRCCKTSGMQCYQKDEKWSMCRAWCSSGPDPTDVNSKFWSCKKLGTRTPGKPPPPPPAKIADWVKDNCSAVGKNCNETQCCKDWGYQCYEK